jgi:predicted AAA+ superfamily ATPase
MLKRKILNKLYEWKSSNNKKALLIKGARQVGKTTTVREFARRNYQQFIEINFEMRPSLKKAFDGDLDARTIILNLSAMGLGVFTPGETLIFFDEIQSCPKARTAIKFLVEDGRFDYIASGSLLGINYKDVSSYPVGFEETYEMFPLDFEEFLWAKGITQEVIDKLRDCYLTLMPVETYLHDKIMQAYREYLVVGGMPDVVRTFLENDDFGETLRVQKSILHSYRDDIAKYAGKDKILVKDMFDAIPEQLGKSNKRFILADLQKGATAKRFENASLWLAEAGIGYLCFNISSLELPFSISEKRSMYKLYLHDTGLLCALAMDDIQSELLLGNISINEGMVTENAVASALRKKDIPLHYYDKKSRKELDFVFKDKNAISIIEVKSGKEYKRHASLDAAESDHDQAKINRRIVFSKYNIEIGESGILYLPLYMAMFMS